LQNKQTNNPQETPKSKQPTSYPKHKQQEFQSADHHSFAVSEQKENTKEVFAFN